MSTSDGAATRVVATAGLMLATLTYSLDTTIANVALPHVQGSLSAAQDQITWVLTSYIVATAIMTPLTGWVAARIGSKRLFLLSVAAFVIVSVLCGLATNLPELVFFRMLQGFAGAAMIPISQAAIFDLWPQSAIPQVMAVWSAVVTVGPILGPTLGGYLTEHFSWRWVFYINLPIGALAYALVWIGWRPRAEAPRRPFDVLGFFAIAAFMISIQLMMDRGPGLDWFDSTEIRIEALIAACSLYVFIAQTMTSRHPFLDREILADRNFVGCVILSVVISAVLYSTSALLPTMMQSLLGYSALQSGIASAPRGYGSVVALSIVPWMTTRFGARKTMALGIVTSGVALFLMSRFDLSMTARPIEMAGFVQGFGQGLVFNPMSVLSFATLAPQLRTEAAVMSNMMRTVGGSLGIAGVQAVYLRESAAAHERLAAQIVPSDPLIRWSLPNAFDGAAGRLDAVNAEVTRQASMIAYDQAFSLLAIGTLILLPLLLILRPAQRQPAEPIAVHAD